MRFFPVSSQKLRLLTIFGFEAGALKTMNQLTVDGIWPCSTDLLFTWVLNPGNRREEFLRGDNKVSFAALQ